MRHEFLVLKVKKMVKIGVHSQFSLAATSVTSALEVIFIMRCAI